MNNEYELSWTELLSKDAIVNRLDETVLELDILKLKYKELQREVKLYEKLYHEALNIALRVGL